MMKKISMVFPLLALVACENTITLDKVASVSGVVASDICSGKVVAGVTGTANCSGGGGGGSSSVTEGFYVLAGRSDVTTVGDWSAPSFWADLVSGAVDRSSSVLSFQDIYSDNNFLTLFKSKYQAVPNPVVDSDGFFGDNPEGLEKKHFLETIVGRPDQECGTSGTISQRVEDCGLPSKNGAKAFYDGRQYGQMGEGDWRLVTRLSTGEEVWRDERTKLLWSDKTATTYNWYRAAGYAKQTATSQAETYYNSQPGSGTQCYDASWNNEACQPVNPISLCAEVDDDGLVIAGGADSLYDGTYTPTSDPSIEKAFKGNLDISHNVIWKLPSVDDWKLADVNGLRKVLPNLYDSGNWYYFWSSSSYSYSRDSAWVFEGPTGYIGSGDRGIGYSHSVRCVAFSRD